MIKKIFQLPFLPIVFAPIILFSPLLFTGKSMFWGTPSLQFVPWWSWAWETLLNGHLPLWNPLVGMGAPLIANYQSALFYPPYWLYFLFYVIGGIGAMAWAQSLMVVLHLIWAGLGMAFLVRRLGLGRLAQSISGLAFSLSGYLVARSWFASINAAVAWLPWVMLCAFIAIQQPNIRKNWLKLGLVIGLQFLAGHAQTSWYTLVLAGLWLGFWSWKYFSQDNQREPFNSKILAIVRMEFRFGLTVLYGLFLAAVQLFPTAVYLMQSQRSSAVEMELALNYSFWPWRILDFIVPGFFGSQVQGDFWGYGNYWEDAIYIGLLPFLLVLGFMPHFLIRWQEKKARQQQTNVVHRRPLVVLLLVIILVAFLLALGKNTPIFPWLYRFVPTFDMFQAPTRISIWAIFSLALLAGIGAEVWRRPAGRGLYWTRLGTIGALAISLGAGLAYFAMGDVRATFIRATTWAGFWGFGVGLLSLLAPTKVKQIDSKPWWTWAVVIFMAFDVVIAGWGLVPGIELDFYSTGANPAMQNDKGRVFLSAEHEYKIKYEHFLSFESFNPDIDWDGMRTALLPNLNMVDGIASTSNFDPLVPGRYLKWMQALGEVDEAKRDTLLQLMGVSTIERLEGSETFGVRFDPIENVERFRWVPCAKSVEDAEDAWEQVFVEPFDPEITVILEGQNPAQTPDCMVAGALGQVRLVSENPNQIVLIVDVNASGWVVVSDVYYPGWNAWVDGKSVPIWQANYLFRAIEVESGQHQIMLRYQPKELYLGGFLSLVSWMSLLGIYRSRKL